MGGWFKLRPGLRHATMSLILDSVGDQVSVTDAAQVVGLVRDIIFILLLLLATFATLILYRKASAVLDSARRTMKGAEEIVSTVSNSVVRPASAGSRVASIAGKALASLLRLAIGRRHKGGSSNG